MDYIKDLHELCETLSREIGEANEKIRASGGKLSAGDLEYIDKLTHALKSVKTTIAMMDGDGYSGYHPGNAYADGHGRSYRGNSYRDSSYQDNSNRGSSYKRDSMGRYSRDYSRDGGMVEELRDLMEDAPDERTKQEFRRFISKIESM